MMLNYGFRGTLLAATILAAAASVSSPAAAQDSDARISAIEKQIQSLQQELQRVKRDLATRDAQVRAAQAEAGRSRAAAQQLSERPPVIVGQQPAPAAAAQQAAAAAAPQPPEKPLPPGTVRVGGLTITVGGFVELAGIYRSRNEVADIGSNFNTGIPFPQSQLNHEQEFRGTARQSRLSLLVQGQPDDDTNLAAYFETDFQGAAPTANSIESNSYNLRIRQIYATLDRSDLGLHVLAGQAWSLLTMDQIGITPRKENIPLTIDAQYVPGFTWTRNPQLRVAKDFDDHKFWLAASLESPQTNFSIGPNGTGLSATVNSTNPGGSGFFSGNSYSADIAPDIILKAAYDPGFGHYEAYGLARFMRTRVSVVGTGHNDVTLAGGGGAAMILPLIPHALDFQASFLAGYGIGRYGSAQLPDATISANGSAAPLPEVQALVGLVGHPDPAVDLYAYLGTERAGAVSFSAGGKGFGYGSPLYSNAGCEIELSPLACTANTSAITQGTVGVWWRVLHGNYGTAEVGAQYSYTERSIFQGIGGAPSTNEQIVMTSIRYLPFQ